MVNWSLDTIPKSREGNHPQSFLDCDLVIRCYDNGRLLSRQAPAKPIKSECPVDARAAAPLLLHRFQSNALSESTFILQTFGQAVKDSSPVFFFLRHSEGWQWVGNE